MSKDLVTQMAETGLEMTKMYGQQVSEVTQAPVLEADDLVDLYLKANFEQRFQMFNEIVGAQGADGLELCGDIYRKAAEILAGEE